MEVNEMANEDLTRELLKIFIMLKKSHFHDIVEIKELNQNQKIVLFIMHDISVGNKVSLSDIRQKICLAPSTVTAIITSLEEDGLIERNIDKNDRRNIFLQITPKGLEYTNRAHQNMMKNLNQYIDYMGEEDARTLLRLVKKTANYFEERKNDR